METDPSSIFSITSQSCQRWTLYLTDDLMEQIIEYLHILYDAAIKTSQQNLKNDTTSIYGFFQRRCLSVSDIPFDELDKRVSLLEERIQNLQTVIKNVLKLNFAVMSVVRVNNLSQIKIPTVDKRDFVKKCYQNSALEVGCKNPQWFDKSIESQKRLVYLGYAKTQINKVIMKTIIDYLPIQTLTSSNRTLRVLSRSPKRRENYSIDLKEEQNFRKSNSDQSQETKFNRQSNFSDSFNQQEKIISNNTKDQNKFREFPQKQSTLHSLKNENPKDTRKSENPKDVRKSKDIRNSKDVRSSQNENTIKITPRSSIKQVTPNTSLDSNSLANKNEQNLLQKDITDNILVKEISVKTPNDSRSSTLEETLKNSLKEAEKLIESESEEEFKENFEEDGEEGGEEFKDDFEEEYD